MNRGSPNTVVAGATSRSLTSMSNSGASDSDSMRSILAMSPSNQVLDALTSTSTSSAHGNLEQLASMLNSQPPNPNITGFSSLPGFGSINIETSSSTSATGKPLTSNTKMKMKIALY